MVTLIRPWPTRRAKGRALHRVVMPLLAGGAMLGASVLPWLTDPLGTAFPAWQLPVDIGWQICSGLFSYGLLCILCSLYSFFILYLSWQKGKCRDPLPYGPAERTITTTRPPRRGAGNRKGSPLQSLPAPPSTQALRTHSTLAGLLCLMPICLFFIQYLFIDMKSIAQLAQHEFQSLFIQYHFGYHVAAQFIPIRLDTFDPSTLNGRFALLLDQIQPGLFLPFLSTFCLLRRQALSFRGRYLGGDVSRRGGGWGQAPPLRSPPVFWFQKPRAGTEPCPYDNQIPTLERQALLGQSVRQQSSQQKRRRVRTFPLIVCSVLLLVVLGRGPAALACRFQAKHLLATGDYAHALTWINRASMLNPSLEELSAYHIERGQAHYYLHPTQPSLESQAYLAGFYLTQEDYLSAYQELMTILHQYAGRSTPSWLINELDITLTRLAEMQHPLNGPPALRINKDVPSIAWLNTLIQIDPGNVYAHYTLGRIEYDIHDFPACEKQMLSVINLNSDHNILSSVYTYLSLSSEYQGDYVKARDYLFKAQDLDPSYRNNTAREEMSGLH